METSTEPWVVVQTNSHGRGVIVGLAYEKDPIGRGSAELRINSFSTGRLGDCSTAARDSNGASETEPTSRASTRWADLRTRLRRSRGSTIQPRFSFLRSTTIDRLVPLLSDENPKTQEQAAKKLAEISLVVEYRSMIANSPQAIAGLTRLLLADKPCSYAAVALGNLAAVEDNLESFKQFPDTVTGLVRLLFRYDDVLAQQEAAMGLSNLSLWRDGAKMILDTPRSVKGLVGLAIVPQSASRDQYCGQDEAKRTLLNLALSRENGPILDCPIFLGALAGCFTIHRTGDRRTCCLVTQENAVKALASLTYTKENARKIAKSNEFPRFLAVLVHFLGNSGPTAASSMEPARAGDDGLEVRKMAAIALANLSITEDIQRMVAEYPNSLSGLFKSLRVQDGRSALRLQLQECAAMALGNLALAKANRRKIVDFGGGDGLAGLTVLLFQDDNPGGQEYAAWALANLSHDPQDSEDTAVKIAASPKIVRGLARLLQLPTKAESGSQSRIGAQEQSVRALANLSYPRASQVKIARVRNVVKALAAALLSRRCQQNLSPRIQEHAARALANLTCAKENWSSSELFGDALRALVDVISTDNAEASEKARKYGAIALGNFALAPSHHLRLSSLVFV